MGNKPIISVYPNKLTATLTTHDLEHDFGEGQTPRKIRAIFIEVGTTQPFDYYLAVYFKGDITSTDFTTDSIIVDSGISKALYSADSQQAIVRNSLDIPFTKGIRIHLSDLTVGDIIQTKILVEE